MLADVFDILVALFLVALNGFFVAAEFALVKVRGSRLDVLARSGSLSGRLAQWFGKRLDSALSACQLGITMASLALGWVGEPAFAELVPPLFESLGIGGPQVVHTAAFIVAFTTITALHLVVGEQAPKIFAIRRPETMLMWCALPLAFFYVIAYPLLWALNVTTAFLLRRVGIDNDSEHDLPHSEDEIRGLVTQAHAHGELTGSEHHLINAVFEFDDTICRGVMVPRSEVVYFNVAESLSDCLTEVKRSKHTRYPVCERNLDNAIGILHVKDLIDFAGDDKLDFRSVMRPLHHVPESMPISRLLRHFQHTHQLMALVDDEHGTVVGIVTLENVLEQIVGPVEDEFDSESAHIKEEGPNRFLVNGSTPLNKLNQQFDLALETLDVDTLSGYLTAQNGRAMQVGDKLNLGKAIVEVLEIDGTRATKTRLTFNGAEAS